MKSKKKKYKETRVAKMFKKLVAAAPTEAPAPKPKRVNKVRAVKETICWNGGSPYRRFTLPADRASVGQMVTQGTEALCQISNQKDYEIKVRAVLKSIGIK